MVHVDRRRWRTQSEARIVVIDYLETFSYPRRRHSALGSLSPAEHENRQHHRRTAE
jgi:hypothetical protein